MVTCWLVVQQSPMYVLILAIKHLQAISIHSDQSPIFVEPYWFFFSIIIFLISSFFVSMGQALNWTSLQGWWEAATLRNPWTKLSMQLSVSSNTSKVCSLQIKPRNVATIKLSVYLCFWCPVPSWNSLQGYGHSSNVSSFCSSTHPQDTWSIIHQLILSSTHPLGWSTPLEVSLMTPSPSVLPQYILLTKVSIYPCTKWWIWLFFFCECIMQTLKREKSFWVTLPTESEDKFQCFFSWYVWCSLKSNWVAGLKS